MSPALLAIILCAAFFKVEPARILCVYPVPSISHQVVFRALTLELVKRGHEVVVITSDPLYKNEKPPRNLIEIDISPSYKILEDALTSEEYSQFRKRGNIWDQSTTTELFPYTFTAITQVFKYTEVNRLIENKSAKFDLVIVEALCQSSLMFSKIFDAPAIIFSSFYGWPTNYEAVGATSRHPVLFPHVFRSKFRNLSILEKLEQLYYEYKLWEYDNELERLGNDILKDRFGSEAPTIAELKKNVVLLFTNNHPIFDGNRPVPPAVVNLGALHLQPVKALPKDLQSYLDSSSRGVIYVSLGTNVRPSQMEKDFLDAFLDAFEALPYDILWKFDGDHLERLPKNVKIQKWFPQRDMLGHKNMKAFVMQGGLQSTDEAIDAELPLVAIPILADQWFNANKYVDLGIGITIDSFTMTAEDLIKAVNTLIHDKSYKENIKTLKGIMRDQPSTPLERAVWWTEHVLRHRGSRHLLGAAAHYSWTEYLMIDVLAALATVGAVLVVVICATSYCIVKTVLRIKGRIKVKQN